MDFTAHKLHSVWINSSAFLQSFRFRGGNNNKKNPLQPKTNTTTPPNPNVPFKSFYSEKSSKASENKASRKSTLKTNLCDFYPEQVYF